MKKFIIFILLLALSFTKSEYRVLNIINQTDSSINLHLEYTGNQTYFLKPTSPIINHLIFSINCYSRSDLAFKIIDMNHTRFQVPQYGIFPTDPYIDFTFPLNSSSFIFTYTQTPFDFKILRRGDNTILFDTTEGSIIFSDYYLQISSQISSNILYGLGQRFAGHLRIQPGKYTIFNRDRGNFVDFGGGGGNTYGHYPIYLLRQPSGNFHFNYLRNSNAMDVIVKNHTKDNYIITYKIIGGIFDFRFFLGTDDPEILLQKFHLYSGRSAIPPFWSLGMHQCRYGYSNINQLELVLKQYQTNQIPLDTIWSDIYYMENYEDFTIDEKNFPLDRMASIISKYHYVPIIDAGIKVGGNAYNQGMKRDVFIKDATGKSPFYGKVWPGNTTFVDFFHPNSSQFWQDMLDTLYNKVKFSGIWLDMNEISNFCNGPCSKPTNHGFDFTHDLPYSPGNDSIQTKTISLNSTHYQNLKQADVHIYFAFLQAAATNSFLTKKGLRPFILSRSSTFGSNKVTFHWTGDNHSNDQFLKISIGNNFLFQIWGIQMVGPDICGFGGDTTEKLCARWFQAGSLYTFTRNHNDKLTRAQQPYSLGAKVLEASKINLRLRYSILKFYYTQFIMKRGLGSIYRPLFLQFPYDLNTFNDQISEDQLLIGRTLMSTPILDLNSDIRQVYFPQVNWYDYYTGEKYNAKTTVTIKNLETQSVPLFLRQGRALLYQEIQNITKSRQLNNQFILKSSLYYEADKSSNENKKYRAFGETLSIIDYNNNTNIATCLNNGCLYELTITLMVQPTEKILQIQINYVGAKQLNQIQIIKGVELFYEHGVIRRILSNPVTINKSETISIVLYSEVIS